MQTLSKLGHHHDTGLFSGGDLTFSSCLNGYFETQMKCKLPWNAKSSQWNETCYSAKHLLQFNELSKHLNKLKTSEMFGMTNCYRSCQSYEYKVVLKFDTDVKPK